MCIGSSPSIPKPTPLQEVKQPDSAILTDQAKKNRAIGGGGGTLLTGPSGIANVATAKTSLLGQ